MLAGKQVELQAQEDLRLYQVCAAAFGGMDADKHRQWFSELASRASGGGSVYHRPQSAAELEALLNQGVQAGEARTEVVDEG